MDKNQPTDTQRRIDALQGSGRLAPAEAASLRDAFSTQAAPPAAAAPAAPATPDLGRAFLSGAMDEAALRKRTQRSAVAMGSMFALMFPIAMVLIRGTVGWKLSVAQTLAIWLPLCAVAGVAFGWLMHRILLQPMVERLVRLRREAGPLQPLGLVDAGQCPTCRAEDFDTWTWRHPAMLHWIANPGLAFNELVLGQLLPARVNLCRQCRTQFVDCPHCRRAFGCVQWGGAFGHWLRLPCPYCNGSIPNLSNALAYVVKAPFLALLRHLGRGGAA